MVTQAGGWGGGRCRVCDIDRCAPCTVFDILHTPCVRASCGWELRLFCLESVRLRCGWLRGVQVNKSTPPRPQTGIFVFLCSENSVTGVRT